LIIIIFILENVLLKKMDCLNEIHINQFGYKKKLSSKHAYFLVNEVADFYRQHGSKIHLISLDASKAFDKLWRDGLFFKLIEKIPNPIWRILFNYYKKSKILVNYLGVRSGTIDCTEGVKQGGVLSPYLFNYFINELLTRCTNENIGAFVGGCNLSIIAYCDDIMLLSPSYGQSIKLLEICFDFAKKWKMDFNPNKSVCLTLGTEQKESLEVNGNRICNVEGFEYLGLPLGKNSFILEFIEEKWKKVEKSMYSLYGLGCKPMGSSPRLISFLFKQYCQSIFRHVLDNVLIPTSLLNELDTRQNLLLKRILGLQKYTHISPLNEALRIESISQIYCKHKIFFLEQIMRSPLCKKIFFCVRENQSNLTKKSTSFCAQLNRIERRLFVNCLEYDTKMVKSLIEYSFKSHNTGLVDSVKFVIGRIADLMDANQDFFYLYAMLNNLLKVEFNVK
jgi:hypothetical protein